MPKRRTPLAVCQTPWEVSHGDVTVMPVHRRHRHEWTTLVDENIAWLEPWSPSNPSTGVVRQPDFTQVLRSHRYGVLEGTHACFVIAKGGRLVGQINLNSVTWGAARSANLGYWVGQRFAGQGIVTLATALLLDVCFYTLSLHRVEIFMRPDNAASLRVPHKLQLRFEGVRERFLHIAGQWSDHHVYAVTAEEVHGSFISRIGSR